MTQIAHGTRGKKLRPNNLGWLFLLLIFSMASRFATGEVATERLVPAQFGPFHNMVDGQGFVWDLNQLGMVMNGTESCFAQSFMLFVNNAQFQTSNAMMTADGSELVLKGSPQQIPGLEVTRRCRADAKSPGARFTEVFTNRGGAALNINAQIFLNCGNGGWQAAVSDAGQFNPGVLGQKETGVVLFAPAQNGQVSVALYLAGPSGEVRPSLQPMNNGRPGFSYSFLLPPQKTAAIVYGAAQCRINDQPDAKAVAALLKPFAGSAWLKDLPGSLRRSVLNLGRLSGDVCWDEVGLGKLLATLEANPGPTDILTFGSGTRLKGTAACGAVTLETRFGTLKTSLDKIAAVIGSRNHNGKAVVVFRDGQLLTGKLQMDRPTFTLNSGLQFEITAARLDRLIMRPAAAGAESDAAAKVALLETNEGERIALAPAARQNFTLVSPWGRFEFPLDDVVRISALAEPLGHRVVLRDGTRLFGYLDVAPLALSTRSFGTLQFSPLALQEIHGLQDEDMLDDPSRPPLPSVQLAGENTLIGRIDLPLLHITASGQTLAVPPNQIRKLRAGGEPTAREAASPDDEALFEAELGDGSTITGKLAEGMLPIRCAAGLRQVPARDVVEILVPTPSVCDPTRIKITGLIHDLGSDKYAVRKAAATALVELGPVAEPQLNETLKESTDAEVQRSARAVLKELGK